MHDWSLNVIHVEPIPIFDQLNFAPPIENLPGAHTGENQLFENFGGSVCHLYEW